MGMLFSQRMRKSLTNDRNLSRLKKRSDAIEPARGRKDMCVSRPRTSLTKASFLRKNSYSILLTNSPSRDPDIGEHWPEDQTLTRHYLTQAEAVLVYGMNAELRGNCGSLDPLRAQLSHETSAGTSGDVDDPQTSCAGALEVCSVRISNGQYVVDYNTADGKTVMGCAFSDFYTHDGAQGSLTRFVHDQPMYFEQVMNGLNIHSDSNFRSAAPARSESMERFANFDGIGGRHRLISMLRRIGRWVVQKLPEESQRSILKHCKCCSVRTTIEGGVLVDPERSTKCIRHVNGAAALMDGTFGRAVAGKIMTKTTIIVTTEPREDGFPSGR